MTQIAASHAIVDRLTALRRRVRTVLALHGAGLVMGAIFGGALVLALADYLVHFRGETRIGLLAVFAVALAVLAFRRLFAPLSTRLTDQFLASRVENVNKDLADELISAVHFIKQGTPTSNALAAKAVEAAEARAKGIRFEDALDLQPALKILGLGAAIMIVTVLIALLNPASTQIAFGRWMNPLGAAHWPQLMNATFVWDTADGKAPKVLPQGEQKEIRARVTGPNAKGTRVFLTSGSDSAADTQELMTLQPGESTAESAVFTRSIEPMGSREIHLQLAAGDDTEQRPVSIMLARRPEIRELSAAIAPPAYVKNMEDATKPAPAVHVDLLQQAGRAVAESRISLLIRSTNAFQVNERGEPDVRFVDQAKDLEIQVSKTARLLDPNTAEVIMPARQSLQARVQIRDANGFENRVGGTLMLEVVPDAQPSVVITEPRQAIRRVPGAVVKIGVSANDDLGVDGGRWQADNFDAKPDAAPRLQMDMPWTSRSVDAAAGSVSAKAEFDWDLAPLGLKVGERLTLYAMVQDNYDINGKRHDWVKSAPLSLTIISEDEAVDDARKDLKDVRARIEGLDRQQQATAAMTKAIEQTLQKTGTASAEQAKQLAELSQQQMQQVASAKAIEQKLEQVSSRLAQNKLDKSDLGKVADFAKDAMKDVGQKNMTEAAKELGKAQDAASKQAESKSGAQKSEAAKDAAQSASAAGKEQEKADATMQDVMKRLDEHNEFGAARDAVNKLIAEQDKIQKEIQKAAANESMRGKDTKELTKEEKEQLGKIANAQEDNKQKTTAAIGMMKKMAENMKNDPASKQSLENAAKAGEDAKVTDAQDAAKSNASDNKLGPASSSAGKAKAGLEQMKDELDKLSKIQLEQLSQQLADLIARLKEHMRIETTLKDDTDKVGKDATKAALQPLGDVQGKVHLATIDTQKRAENTKDARAAAGLIASATEKMQASAVALFGGKQADAVPAEVEAISFLQQAIAKLEEQKKKTDDELKDKDLAFFIKQYEEIKAGEIEVKTASDALPMKKDDMLPRHLRLMAEKAKQQDELIGRIKGLSADEKLKEYEAVIYINTQITEYMTESKERLTKANVGKQLAWNQQKAIDRMQNIIDALKEEKKKKDPFEKPPSDGSGPPPGSGKPPLIPAAAQLKLLKALQVVVNSDTVERNGEITAAKDPAEKNAVGEQVKKLGDQQGKIQDIAKKVIEKLKG